MARVWRGGDRHNTYPVDDLIKCKDELKGRVKDAILARALARIGDNLREEAQRVEVRNDVAPLIRDQE
jgi:hypothetical protein